MSVALTDIKSKADGALYPVTVGVPENRNPELPSPGINRGFALGGIDSVRRVDVDALAAPDHACVTKGVFGVLPSKYGPV